jgi:hypothetical protein
MAGRTYEEVTSGFKPLSLDEIMAIPLAKQAQEDASQLYFDDLQLLEENALASDKDYVQGQVGALKDEATSLSDQMMEQGVDRGFMNKVKGLRTRKNREFSASGNTGKANAAFNAMKANKAAIMSRNDLDPEQKRRGLEEAENNYTGVLQGGEYEDYVGNSSVDYMGEGQKIGAQMTPQTIAASTPGLQWNGREYVDQYNQTVTLTAQQIERVAYDGLKANVKTTNYLNELEALGIIPSADQALREAAMTAANVYQRADMDSKNSYPAWANKKTDAGNPVGEPQWDSQVHPLEYERMLTGLGINEETGDIGDVNFGNTIVKNISDNYKGYWWNDKPSDPGLSESIVDVEIPEYLQALVDENGKADPDKVKEYYESIDDEGNKLQYSSNVQRKIDASSLNQKISETEELYATLKQAQEQTQNVANDIYKIRKDNPAFDARNDDGTYKYSDKAISDIIVETKKNAATQAAHIDYPMNQRHSLFELGQNLLTGSKPEFNGKFVSMQGSVDGVDGGSVILAKSLGMDLIDYEEAMRGGTYMGTVPQHPTMPGAHAIQITIPGENIGSFSFPNNRALTPVTKVVYLNPGIKPQQTYATLSRMNNSLLDYKHFVDNNKNVPANGKHEYIVNQVDPTKNAVNTYVIKGPGSATEKEVKAAVWKNQMLTQRNGEDFPGQVATINGVKFVRLSKEQELFRVSRKLQELYDTTKHVYNTKNAFAE